MSIYDQHDKAFKNVSAFVIIDEKGERVGTVAFKHGQAVSCYLHIIGLEMTKGRAGGGGYDRKSAAAYDAIGKVRLPDPQDRQFEYYRALQIKWAEALRKGNGGSHWDRALTDAGFKVFQAV